MLFFFFDFFSFFGGDSIREITKYCSYSISCFVFSYNMEAGKSSTTSQSQAKAEIWK